MKGEIREYIDCIEKAAEDGSLDKDVLCRQLKVRIGFYQHERLIHLIVTMSFAIFFFLSLILYIVNPYFLLLSALLLVLLIPYIAHYYFLENAVQRLYRIYYSLCENKQ